MKRVVPGILCKEQPFSVASYMKWVRLGVKDEIHIYEGAPYDELEEQMVEITIERGERSRQSRWKGKYDLILRK